MKDSDTEYEFGTVVWRDLTLSKRLVGRHHSELKADTADLWAITVNYIQERTPACLIIEHLAQQGAKIIVGGSDAFAEPEVYLKTGADAVVMDKSGAANKSIIDHILGEPSREPLTGVFLADGTRYKNHIPPMSPENWPTPSAEVVQQTLGIDYWETKLPESLLPIGSVMADIGCDRHCDFCETPLYKVGYKSMSPETALRWFAAQKEAGARSVICPSGQFLGS